MALHARYCTPLEAPPTDLSTSYVDLDVMFLYRSEITDMSVSSISFVQGAPVRRIRFEYWTMRWKKCSNYRRAYVRLILRRISRGR
jgi:hypothetical protein